MKGMSELRAWEVFRLEPGADKGRIIQVYRQLAKTAHPDTGGSQQEWEQLTAAYRTLMEAPERVFPRPAGQTPGQTAAEDQADAGAAAFASAIQPDEAQVRRWRWEMRSRWWRVPAILAAGAAVLVPFGWWLFGMKDIPWQVHVCILSYPASWVVWLAWLELKRPKRQGIRWWLIETPTTPEGWQEFEHVMKEHERQTGQQRP